MSLIQRLKRITAGRIEALLASLERPELVLPQLVREMEQALAQAANAEAKALSALKGAQRRHDEATGRAQRMAQGAALALKAGDEATARAALAAEIDARRQADELLPALQSASGAWQQAADVRRQLSQNLADLRRRSTEIIATARAARAAKTPEGDLLAKGRGLLDAVARMEDNARDQQDAAAARAEVASLLAGDLDPGKLQQLQKDQQVQQRLDQLKRSLGIE